MTSPPPTQKPSYAASASKSSTPSSPQPLNVKKPAITTSVPPTSATIAPAPFNYASIAAKHSSTKPRYKKSYIAEKSDLFIIPHQSTIDQ